METRNEVIGAIARASLQGNLGYFVGSGFSMAMTHGTLKPAPNWIGLLRELEVVLNENLARLEGASAIALPAPDEAFGQSAPLLASNLCRDFATQLQASAEFSSTPPQEVQAAASVLYQKFGILILRPSLLLQGGDACRRDANYRP